MLTNRGYFHDVWDLQITLIAMHNHARSLVITIARAVASKVKILTV